MCEAGAPALARGPSVWMEPHTQKGEKVKLGSDRMVFYPFGGDPIRRGGRKWRGSPLHEACAGCSELLLR